MDERLTAEILDACNDIKRLASRTVKQWFDSSGDASNSNMIFAAGMADIGTVQLTAEKLAKVVAFFRADRQAFRGFCETHFVCGVAPPGTGWIHNFSRLISDWLMQGERHLHETITDLKIRLEPEVEPEQRHQQREVLGQIVGERSSFQDQADWGNMVARINEFAGAPILDGLEIRLLALTLGKTVGLGNRLAAEVDADA